MNFWVINNKLQHVICGLNAAFAFSMSIFPPILTTDTPELTYKGEIRVFVFDWNSNSYSASVTAVMYAVSRYIGLCYNDNRLCMVMLNNSGEMRLLKKSLSNHTHNYFAFVFIYGGTEAIIVMPSLVPTIELPYTI